MSQETRRDGGSGDGVTGRLRRKNISRACQECRRRRMKCDGKKPSCSSCSVRLIQCQYSSAEDRRRPAPKSYVELLRQRIDTLEHILESHSIDIEAAVTSTSDFGQHRSSTKELGHLGQTITPTSIKNSTETSNTNSLNSELKGTFSLDESLNFDQDGEVRYFGPTSGRLEFQATSRTSSSKTGEDVNKTSVRFNRLCQDVLDEDAIPKELEDQLIDLYFIWEQPYFQAVDEKLFRQSRETGGQYYSALLLNSILSLGSRHCDDPILRSDPSDPNTAGRLFLEKAQVLLHYELKWPSITTIQSLLILTNVYCGVGADAACWLYQGMAMRLALDMGLNFDSASIQGTNSLSIEAVTLRRQVYWTLYCCDKLGATYTGRVCTFLDFQAVVELPSDLPFSTDDRENNSVTARFPRSGSLQLALVTICQILEEILLSLYAPKPSIRSHQRPAFLSSCILKLKNWHYDLPEHLRLERLSAPGPPALYTIHMIYYTTHIYLMKPFLVNSEKNGQPDRIATPRQQGLGWSPKDARVLSYQAACDLCNVARKYRHDFQSFRRSPITATHCILSAVLILINAKNLSWEGISASNNERNIELCLQSLEELSTSWNIAKRIGQSVQTLYQNVKNQSLDTQKSSQNRAHRQPTVEDRTDTFTGQSQSDTTSTRAMSIERHPEVSSEDDHHIQNAGIYAMDQEGSLDFTDFSPAFGTLDGQFLTENNLGFYFNSLPSDYGSFDALSRRHFENIW